MDLKGGLTGGKKLAGWARSEGCGQWLYVQLETGDGWCPSGLCLGLILISIFINDRVGSGTPSESFQMTQS